MQETKARRRLVGAISVVLFVGLWQVLPRALGIPGSTLPSPSQLLARLGRMLADERFGNHILVTFGEIWRGVLIGVLIGVGTAVLFAKVRLLERLIMPVVVVIQVTPKIAIAPLLVLWLGLGAGSKVFLVALVTFFPTLVNTLIGLRTISVNVRQLCTLLNLSPWQRFVKVELPSVIPNIVAGLRLGCLAGVTAAVIGEIIGAKAGLGYLVIQSQESGDVAMGLVSVLTLAFIGLALWLGVGEAERRATASFKA